MDRPKAEALIDRLDMKPVTQMTITDKNELLSAMDTILREGVAYDFEEFEQGVICIAAPLYYRMGEPIGAISVSGPAMRMDEERRGIIAKALGGITSQICNELSRLA
jgi:DNA-binding IclR family transcriptional regulator